MRIHSSALLPVLAAAAASTAGSAAAPARPWGLAAGRTNAPLVPSVVGWNAIPRGGDDDSSAAAAAEVEAPPPPPPPPPAAPESPDAAAEAASGAGDEDDFEDLDARVKRAMKKLGLGSDEDEAEAATAADIAASAATPEGAECKDGVCELPSPPPSEGASVPPADDVTDPLALADALSSKYAIPRQVVLAAIGASGYAGNEGETVNVEAVENILEGERMLTSTVDQEAEEVKRLTSEGHDPYLTRRALAFADMNVDDARAILVADEEDEEEERRERAAAAAQAEEEMKEAKAAADRRAKAKAESEMKTVNVAADFDPAAPPGAGGDATAAGAAAGLQGLMGSSGGAAPQGAPKPAKKEDVVFEITEEDQIQTLVVESPVPVLLDVYADWCGPCKMLTPALEQMATKAGGMFRLVKLNTDEHRSVSQSLEVRALPTVFGVRDGRIVNSFQGMPRDEDALRNFMMGLLGAGSFHPPLADAEVKKHASLSVKLLKVAGASSFPFSARERLQDRTKLRLDELAVARGMADAEESAVTVQSLLSNVVRDPFELKYRRVNLENKVLRARVAAFPPCVSILKSAGFVEEGEGGSTLVLAEGKKAVNLAPLVVARDTIDRWIDRNRYNIAAAARKRRDEDERVKLAEETARLQAEAEAKADEYDTDEDDSEEVDPDACSIKVRMEGKKKVHTIAMRADDPLSKLVESLPGAAEAKISEGDQEVRVTCTAKRLVVTSADGTAMAKSLRDHGLAPMAAVVVKIGSSAPPPAAGTEEGAAANAAKKKSSLAERAAKRKSRKKGSQTMQSVGIYAKDDNAKGELIDGGGGVWYEHDVTDDEEEEEGPEAAEGEGDDKEQQEPEDEEEEDEENSGTDEAESE